MKVIVVGGGAAGMMAAGRAAETGAQVILLEKNNILGKKILITGKGRCNVTNSCPIEEIINNFPGNGRFLYSAIYNFSNFHLMDFLRNNGVQLKVERGGRVFPTSDSSKDIVKALEKYLHKGKVKIKTASPVKKILIEDQQVKGVCLENGKVINADKVIVTTGGATYSGTGSTGDGYNWAQDLGHTIIPIRPSLVPLESNDNWVKELQGLSLKNVQIKLQNLQGKILAEEFGEMLFTHFGLSGPIILTISRSAVDYWQKKSGILQVVIDLKPALSIEQLSNRLQRDFEKYSNKHFKNSLNQLLPARLIPVVIRMSQIDPEKVVNQITKDERKRLIEIFKGLIVNVNRSRPLNEGIVTAGGINIKEIHPQRMESKFVKGLYFAGEILDIDGYTGGFNLQAAFSTGYAAGEGIWEDYKK